MGNTCFLAESYKRSFIRLSCLSHIQQLHSSAKHKIWKQIAFRHPTKAQFLTYYILFFQSVPASKQQVLFFTCGFWLDTVTFFAGCLATAQSKEKVGPKPLKQQTVVFTLFRCRWQILLPSYRTQLHVILCFKSIREAKLNY